MKKLNGIIESSNPPEDTNLLWKKGEKLYTFNNGEWHDIDNDTKPMLNISEKLVPKTIINLKEDGTPYIGHFAEETGILYGPTTVEVAEGIFGGQGGNYSPELKGIWVRGKGVTTSLHVDNISQDILFTGDKYIFYPDEEYNTEDLTLSPCEIFLNEELYACLYPGIFVEDGGEPYKLPLGFYKAFSLGDDVLTGIYLNKILLWMFNMDWDFEEVGDSNLNILFEYDLERHCYARPDEELYGETFYTELGDDCILIPSWSHSINRNYVPTISIDTNVRDYDSEICLGIKSKGYDWAPDTIKLVQGDIGAYYYPSIVLKKEASFSLPGNLSLFGLTHTPDMGKKYYYYREDTINTNVIYLVFSSDYVFYIKRIESKFLGLTDKNTIIVTGLTVILNSLTTGYSGTITPNGSNKDLYNALVDTSCTPPRFYTWGGLRETEYPTYMTYNYAYGVFGGSDIPFSNQAVYLHLPLDMTIHWSLLLKEENGAYNIYIDQYE